MERLRRDRRLGWWAIFSQLDQVLRELRSLGELTVERLQQDWLVRRAVERDLQIDIVNGRLDVLSDFRDEVLDYVSS